MRFTGIAALAALSGAPLFAGCVDPACTTEARSSVDVSVVDATGAVQKDAKVTFSVDGGADEPAECVGPSGGGACDAWVAGFERTGSFTVKAESADGTKQASQTVVVTADECHVVSQSMTLTLQ